MIILDTNVLSELFRPEPDPNVLKWLTVIGDDVATTSITAAELLAGVRRMSEGRRKRELGSRITLTLDPYMAAGLILPFDYLAAQQYADVLVLRERAGLPISAPDAQIAAICRTHRGICATRNTKDFAHTGVEILNPWLT